jgi:hypothetical protein
MMYKIQNKRLYGYIEHGMFIPQMLIMPVSYLNTQVIKLNRTYYLLPVTHVSTENYIKLVKELL